MKAFLTIVGGDMMLLGLWTAINAKRGRSIDLGVTMIVLGIVILAIGMSW